MLFPNESKEYRQARERLLEKEIQLRRELEKVAQARRELPLGGELKQDYVFQTLDENHRTREIRFSELFSRGLNTVALYSFMFGPKREKACTMCTSMIDSLNGAAPHIEKRTNLYIVAKSPLPRILEFAEKRGWAHLKFLSSHGNTYNEDYFGETKDGFDDTMMNIFKKDDQKIRHFWGSELKFAPSDSGQDHRILDVLAPTWMFYDLLPDGRGTKHIDTLEYPKGPYYG